MYSKSLPYLHTFDTSIISKSLQQISKLLQRTQYINVILIFLILTFSLSYYQQNIHTHLSLTPQTTFLPSLVSHLYMLFHYNFNLFITICHYCIYVSSFLISCHFILDYILINIKSDLIINIVLSSKFSTPTSHLFIDTPTTHLHHCNHLSISPISISYGYTYTTCIT